MNLYKISSLLPIAFGSILSVYANDYKFDDIKLDQVKNEQTIYKPKDKLDKLIIKGATYSTKFVPLLNDGSDVNEYSNIMANDGKRLLVDAGFDFVNSAANSQIQSIPFFAQTSVNLA